MVLLVCSSRSCVGSPWPSLLCAPDVHLTNVAIQKKGDDYDADSGGKWDVRSLKLYLLSKYGVQKVNELFFNIQLICIRSLLAVQKVIINDKHSFEMYGFDILITANLRPWLIEVNASPSLTANTPADYQMKLALLHDTIAVVDVEKKSVPSNTKTHAQPNSQRQRASQCSVCARLFRLRVGTALNTDCGRLCLWSCWSARRPD